MAALPQHEDQRMLPMLPVSQSYTNGNASAYLGVCLRSCVRLDRLAPAPRRRGSGALIMPCCCPRCIFCAAIMLSLWLGLTCQLCCYRGHARVCMAGKQRCDAMGMGTAGLECSRSRAGPFTPTVIKSAAVTPFIAPSMETPGIVSVQTTIQQCCTWYTYGRS
jgi:hypothetical protein